MLNDILLSKEQKMSRLQICQTCPQYRNKLLGIIPTTRFARCGVCGCFLNAKAALKDMKCPEGKWPLVSSR